VLHHAANPRKSNSDSALRQFPLGNKHGQQGLFEARETLRLARFMPEHANLLLEQSNLAIFLRVGQMTDSEQLNSRRK
jgi:hypothetical protein